MPTSISIGLLAAAVLQEGDPAWLPSRSYMAAFALTISSYAAAVVLSCTGPLPGIVTDICGHYGLSATADRPVSDIK